MRRKIITTSFFVSLFSLMALSACSHKPVAPPQVVVPHDSNPTKEKEMFDAGFKALSKNDYKTASEKFSSLNSLYPATKWLPHAEYNLGLSLEGLGKYTEASEQYKKVVDYYQGARGRDSAEALYRLSVCYEVANDDTKVILALIELQNQTRFLNHDTVDVELPARLAAAYARQGNEEQARTYFAHAENGLKHVRVLHPKGDTLLWLPKTLYSMGHVPLPKKDLTPEGFKNYLGSLNQNQIWLVRAAEMGDNPWSKKASEELINVYFDAWGLIDQHQVPHETDKIQSMKERQEQQKSMALDLDSSISKLKLERIPPSPLEPESHNLTAVFNGVSGLEKRLDVLLQEPYVQDVETPEAQKREGLKREGVIRDDVSKENSGK